MNKDTASQICRDYLRLYIGIYDYEEHHFEFDKMPNWWLELYDEFNLTIQNIGLHGEPRCK